MNDTSATHNDKFLRLLSDAQRGAIDAQQAIVGTKEHYDAVYGSNFAAVIRMLEEMDRGIAGINHAQGATVAKQELITEFLRRNDTKLDKLAELPQKVEAVSNGLTALAVEFSSTGEALNQWRGDVDGWRHEVDLERASFRQSRDESIAERQQLKTQLRESQEDRQLIHAELQEAKRERADLAAQLERILTHLGLGDA